MTGNTAVGRTNEIKGKFMTKIPQPVISTPINSSLTNARLSWSNSWNVSTNPPTYVVQYSAAHAAVDPIIIKVEEGKSSAFSLILQ